MHVYILANLYFLQTRFVAMGMQGWRRSMEDSHIAHTDLENGVSLYGVFDGHGGKLDRTIGISNSLKSCKYNLLNNYLNWHCV